MVKKKKKKGKGKKVLSGLLIVFGMFISLVLVVGTVVYFTQQTIVFGAYEYEWITQPSQAKVDSICGSEDPEFEVFERAVQTDVSSYQRRYHKEMVKEIKTGLNSLGTSAIICEVQDLPLRNPSQPHGLVGFTGVGECEKLGRLTVNVYSSNAAATNVECSKKTPLDDYCSFEGTGMHFGYLNSFKFYCDGVQMNANDLTPIFSDADDATITIKYALPTNNIPDQAHVREFSCPLYGETRVGTVGRMMATETFGAGDEINIYSFRYPVNFFCNRHPVIVTSGDSGATWNDFEVYEKFVNGETYKIPEDETHTYFYVIYANEQLPISCKRGEFDPDKNECVWTPGIVHFCSEGNFDADDGVCVVHPEAIKQCIAGRFDVDQGLCIWNPPVQAVCPDEDGDGIADGIYNVDLERCEYSPPVAYECLSSAYTYNPDTDKCEIYPEKTIACPPGYIYKEASDKCERDAEVSEFCYGGGIYNPNTGRCEVKVEDVEAVCDRGYLDEGRMICIFEPDLEHYCPQGFYEASTDTCRVEPNMKYLCLLGDYDEDMNKCVIEPEELIVCRTSEGFEYDADLDMCTRAPEEKPDDTFFDGFLGIFQSIWDMFKNMFNF